MNANSNCRTLWLVWKVLSFKKFLFVQWAWSHFLFGNIKLQFIFLQVFESKFIEVDIVTRYICTENFQLSVLIWYFKMTFKLNLWKFLYSGLVCAMTNTKKYISHIRWICTSKCCIYPVEKLFIIQEKLW